MLLEVVEVLHRRCKAIIEACIGVITTWLDQWSRWHIEGDCDVELLLPTQDAEPVRISPNHQSARSDLIATAVGNDLGVLPAPLGDDAVTILLEGDSCRS